MRPARARPEVRGPRKRPRKRNWSFNEAGPRKAGSPHADDRRPDEGFLASMRPARARPEVRIGEVVKLRVQGELQ